MGGSSTTKKSGFLLFWFKVSPLSEDHSQICSSVRGTIVQHMYKVLCQCLQSSWKLPKKSKLAQILTESALNYYPVLAAFPVPDVMCQSFDLSDGSSDFHHTLALLRAAGWISHPAVWCLQGLGWFSLITSDCVPAALPIKKKILKST